MMQLPANLLPVEQLAGRQVRIPAADDVRVETLEP